VTSAEVLENLQFLRTMGLSQGNKIASIQFLMKLKLFHGLPLVEQLRADGLLREKGMEIDYIFKDRQFGLAYSGLTAVGACANAFQLLRRHISRAKGRSGS